MAADSYRLFVATDWDAGFQLTPDTKPLDDVLPGGEYVAECTAANHGVLDSVIVRDFALDRLYVGKKFANLTADRELPALGIVNDRLYYLEPALPIAIGADVRAVLKNISDSPKKLKVAVIARSDQTISSATPQRWRVEGVHVGKTEKPLAPSCPTCDSPDRDTRRMVNGATAWCRDAWHGDPLPTSWPEKREQSEPVVHAPKIARTLYDGPGNATFVHGCSCGAQVATTKAFAEHVGMPVRAVDAMLGLLGVIYDLCDYPNAITREETARRVARCLEFSR